MTLGELFQLLADNPVILVFYFIAVPMTAFLAGTLDRNEGHLSPWKYLYSSLIYLIVIPGLFSVVLNGYLFLFEHLSFMESNIYIQLLPIASMLATLWLIRLEVDFDLLPGFHTIWRLFSKVGFLLLFFWISDRTGIWAITEWSAGLALGIFILSLFVLSRIKMR